MTNPNKSIWQAAQASIATPQQQSVTVTDSSGRTDYEYVAGPDRKGGVAVFVKGHDYLKVIYDASITKSNALIEPLSAATGGQESEAQAVAEVFAYSNWIEGRKHSTIVDSTIPLEIGTKLYLAPPSALAIETAAKMQAAELVRKRIGHRLADEIKATIPQDGRTALEEFGMRVAKEVFMAYGGDAAADDFSAIVTSLIGEKK